MIESLWIGALWWFKKTTLNAGKLIRIVKLIEIQATEQITALGNRTVFGNNEFTLFRINGDGASVAKNRKTFLRHKDIVLIDMELAISCVEVFPIGILNLEKTRAIYRKISVFPCDLHVSGSKIHTGCAAWNASGVLGCSDSIWRIFRGLILVTLDGKIGLLKTSHICRSKIL